jgi:DnaJ-class molecular chaperone
MKNPTVKNIEELFDETHDKFRIPDVAVPVQACSTCKGHKLLLNEVGFPMACNKCNGSGKQN